jgi:hypothetical protein
MKRLQVWVPIPNSSNSMKQNTSSEADNSLAGQEIPYLVRNPNIRYRVHLWSLSDLVESSLHFDTLYL